MRSLCELQHEIESVRIELDEEFLRRDEVDTYYYQISIRMDKLIEEYLETKEELMR